MMIGAELELEDDLIAELVDSGYKAHWVAQAHHNDPGSNGFTFGTDRYQRCTELAVGPLLGHGFKVRRRGAGLIARRAGVEMQFAVARGVDLNDPASFDADSSPARQRVGLANSQQLALEGMPEPKAAPIVHVVWSGTPDQGLTAVHIGRLVLGAGDRLAWAILRRVDGVEPKTGASAPLRETGVPSYTEQPVPSLHVSSSESAVTGVVES